MQHGKLVVELADHRAPLHVRADDQADRAMAVDVVPAVLGIVFIDEDRGLGPEAAVRDGLHEPAHGQVVVGHQARGVGNAALGAGGVVLRQVDDHEVRPLRRSSRIRWNSFRKASNRRASGMARFQPG